MKLLLNMIAALTLLVCIPTLQASTIEDSSIELQAVDGLNVTRAYYSGGAFVDQGDGTWIERNFDNTHYFVEISRSTAQVNLKATDRDVRIILSIEDMMVYYLGPDDFAFWALYPITAVY